VAERKHSEVRQRTCQVCVRLNPAESALLKAEASRRGWSEARVLREAFIASLPAGPEQQGERDA
jgi:hypothetical protein